MVERIKLSTKRVRFGKFYVYLLFRLDRRLCYVGKGKGNRWNEHESPARNHYNPHLRNIILKAKKLGKKLPKIKLRKNLTEEEAFELEIFLIKFFGRGRNGCLVNMTDGGDGMSGYKHPEKTRKLLSRLKLGNKNGAGHTYICTNETRLKLRIAAKNKPKPSEETKAKISHSLKNVPKAPEHVAKVAAKLKGRKVEFGWWSTEEGRAKQKANNRGHTGHKHSDETKAVIRAKTIAQMAVPGARELVSNKIKTLWAQGRYGNTS